MTIARAIATIVGCAVAFAALGTTCGYMLGKYFPGYYRSIAPVVILPSSRRLALASDKVSRKDSQLES